MGNNSKSTKHQKPKAHYKHRELHNSKDLAPLFSCVTLTHNSIAPIHTTSGHERTIECVCSAVEPCSLQCQGQTACQVHHKLLWIGCRKNSTQDAQPYQHDQNLMISSFQPCMSCRMEVEQEVLSSEGHACHQEQPTLWQRQPPAKTQSNLITSQWLVCVW